MFRYISKVAIWAGHRLRRDRLPRILAGVVLVIGGRAVPVGWPPDVTKSPRCSEPEYRQFDFWAGDWDVYDPDNQDKLEGHSHVEVILGGCALAQVYEGTNGLNARSFVAYDASRKLWHQTLVSNRGQLLTIEGKLEDDRIVLRGSQLSADGHRVDWRSVWTPRKDGVLESAATSGDGGVTWRPVFDILFRRHKP